MEKKLLYVETIAAEALDLAEDIVCLEQVKALLNKARGRYIAESRIDEIWEKVNAMEREMRFYLRHKYLEPKPKEVYESLRKRVKEEISKEMKHGTL